MITEESDVRHCCKEDKQTRGGGYPSCGTIKRSEGRGDAEETRFIKDCELSSLSPAELHRLTTQWR